MVENTQKMIDSTRRRITAGCRFALSLVAIVVVLIAALNEYLAKDQLENTAVVNMSGRQRTLSQRIALLTNDLITLSEDRRREVLQELYENITEMEHSHQVLTRAAVEGKGKPLAGNIWSIYFEQPLKLDDQVSEYLQHAHAVLQLVPSDLRPDQPDVMAIERIARGNLIKSLFTAVQEYQAQQALRFSILSRIILALSVFALLVLASVALLVLKPAIAYVGHAQKRLEELNTLKGDFLANMSHEIRTPMNGIFGMTELLIDSNLNERQQNYVRTLQNSADHLLGLINDILDFSKLESGHMKLDPVRFNLLSTIEDILDLLASRAREKNLELLLRYQPGTPRFVMADPGRVRQVLFNLIGNAIKFTDVGYVLVHISVLAPTKAPDSRVWLNMRIEDTGIGIPENKISSLFEKFMQVESGSTRARQGTGLGLAICRNLVNLMGGSITLESLPGKGTVFTCVLPLDGADDPQISSEHPGLLDGKRVLLVDDLAPNRLLYKEILSAASIHCLVAENAEEALSILKYEHDSERPIHAVLSDYVMPGTNGMELTRLIKTDARLNAIPVIILSSAGERGLIRQFADVGVSACLAKPVARQHLFDTLSHIIQASERGEKHNIITTETSVSLSVNRLLVRERPLYGTHILLAEDNRVNREITTEMLEGFGCKVSTAQTGQEAVELARKEQFDLIFMDCQMPVMDGYEATRHIVSLKAKGTVAPVPIIALTANAMKGDRERCLEEGMDDYLSKPMRKSNLEAILLKWLRSKLEASIATAPASKPADVFPVSDDYGIDTEIFATASEMLREKLSLVITYFLEDADNYISRIAAALDANDPANIIIPAHTLKSSSRQFGITQLADYAARAEHAARDMKESGKSEDLKPLLSGMREALAKARPFLESMKKREGIGLPVKKDAIVIAPALSDKHPQLALMVGSNPEEFYTISRSFEYLNYRVLWATTHVQALELAAAFPFSVVMLSASLAEGDIHYAIRQLKALIEGKSIIPAPLWMVTSHASTMPHQKWLDAGISQILHMPLDKEKLQSLCHTLIPFDGSFWAVSDKNLTSDFPTNVVTRLSEMRAGLLQQIRKMQNALLSPTPDIPEILHEIHAAKSTALALGYMRIAALMANLEHMVLGKQSTMTSGNISVIAGCLNEIALD